MGRQNPEKSVTDKASDPGCHEAPWSLLNPRSLRGEPVLPPAPVVWGGPQHRVDEAGSKAGSLFREKQRHHTASSQRFRKVQTQLERNVPNCKRNGRGRERVEEKRERRREKKEGGQERGLVREGGMDGLTDRQTLLALGRSSRPVTIRKGV